MSSFGRVRQLARKEKEAREAPCLFVSSHLRKFEREKDRGRDAAAESLGAGSADTRQTASAGVVIRTSWCRRCRATIAQVTHHNRRQTQAHSRPRSELDVAQPAIVTPINSYCLATVSSDETKVSLQGAKRNPSTFGLAQYFCSC